MPKGNRMKESTPSFRHGCLNPVTGETLVLLMACSNPKIAIHGRWIPASMPE